MCFSCGAGVTRLLGEECIEDWQEIPEQDITAPVVQLNMIRDIVQLYACVGERETALVGLEISVGLPT